MNIGDKAPEILGLNEKGEEIRLSNYKGKPLRQLALRAAVNRHWREKRQCLSPAPFSAQRPKSPYFARLGVFHGCRISSFDRTRCAGLWSNFLFSRTVAQRPVLGFRWVRARLCPENRTQPPHAAHAGGQVVFCRACWSASKRFRMRSCSHSVSSFASFCS